MVVKDIFDEEGNACESASHPRQRLFVDLGCQLDRNDILSRQEIVS